VLSLLLDFSEFVLVMLVVFDLLLEHRLHLLFVPFHQFFNLSIVLLLKLFELLGMLLPSMLNDALFGAKLFVAQFDSVLQLRKFFLQILCLLLLEEDFFR